MPFRCYTNLRAVPVLHTVTDDEFFWRYMWTNQPVLIGQALLSGPDGASLWNAIKDWVTADGHVNVARLRELYGSATVPIVKCTSTGEYGDQPRLTMTMNEFLDYWERRPGKADAQEATSTAPLYLKDWHPWRARADYRPYETPELFQDDWLNSYWDSLGVDDYRFCYMGPAGAWVDGPLERNSIWTVELLRHASRPNVFVSNVHAVDPDAFPRFHEAQPLVVEQGPRETIFIPSGWYHQVENLEDTVSINHNWGNACNCDLMWDCIADDLRATRSSIEHLRPTTSAEEWSALCEQILRSNTGMNVQDFVQYLRHAFERVITSYPPLTLPNVSRPVGSSTSAGPPSAVQSRRGSTSLHDRRQWALSQLRRVIQAMVKEVGAIAGLEAFGRLVEEATVKEGLGMAAPIHPPRATLDAVPPL